MWSRCLLFEALAKAVVYLDAHQTWAAVLGLNRVARPSRPNAPRSLCHVLLPERPSQRTHEANAQDLQCLPAAGRRRQPFGDFVKRLRSHFRFLMSNQ
jgi:hypothetical protein